MRRSASAIVVPALLLSGVLLAAPGSADTTQPSEALRAFAAGPVSQQAVKRTPGNLGDASDLFVEDEVLVTFKKGVKRQEAARVHAVRGGGTVLSAIRGLGPRIDHVRLAPGLSVAQALRRYERDPRVAFAEPNFRYELAAHDDVANLWGLENDGATAHEIEDPPPPTAVGTLDADIDAHGAWAIEDGSSNPTIVAVIDSGARITHDDLDGNLWVNAGETPGNFTDDDGNGYVDDVNGCSFAPPQCTNLVDEAPNGGHGTHVAGTIAAEDDGAGITGVCPHCQIMVVKFDLTTAGEVQAYAYARKNGADVINGSFGGPIWSKTAYNAIKQLNNAGIVAVFAAANSQLDNDLALAHPGSGDLSPAFPASYNLPNIIAVAASNHHDQYGYFTGCNTPTIAGGGGFPKKVCAFSNVGHDSVDIAAPGVDIRSSVKTGDTAFDVYNGTSMAAPHVAGVAGLVHSANPGLTAVQIKNKIMNGADKNLSPLSRFYSQVLKGGSAAGKFTRTSGRLNAEGALNAAATNATPRTDGNVDGAKRIAKSKKGRVRYPDDVNDVYRKRLKKGKRYRVVLKVGKKDFDLWIWKPGVREIFQFEAGCYFNGKCPVVAVGFSPKGKNEVVTFKAKKAGVYYFQVEAWLKMKGGYKLIIKRI